MKRTFTLLLYLLTVCLAATAQQAKYVFLFIGDGMGVNHVNAAETTLAAAEGRIGIVPLCFPSLPYGAMVNTYSATNGITDSAAGGTALASGCKTYNHSIGTATDSITPLYSIAEWAHRAGYAVGIATTVSIDHATPAAFYAHATDRNRYYEIGYSLPATGYEFFAGSDFLKPESGKVNLPAPDHEQRTPQPANLYDRARSMGYTIARGYADYQSLAPKAERMLLLQSEAASAINRKSVPYAIDRREGDGSLSLAQMTQAGIDFLSRSDKGFFLMAEGGKIDWAAHAGDAATMVREVADMDDAIRVAYAFYQAHPDETLIVVSADHETGGLALGTGSYTLHMDYLMQQRVSVEAYSKALEARFAAGTPTFEQVMDDLRENFGFGAAVPIKEKHIDRLRAAYDNAVSGEQKTEKSLYASVGEIANTARLVMADCAHVHWGTGSHTNGYVPAFAIGVGASCFTGRINNTEIAPRIAEAMGIAMP